MIRLLAVVVLASCGSSSPPASRPVDPQTHAGNASQPPSVTAALTEQDCDHLFTHTVEVTTTQPLSAEEKAKVTSELRDKMMRECLEQPRPLYECAMAARDATAIATCQRTPSSSTSNNSVAPPGITPPAPRAP